MTSTATLQAALDVIGNSEPSIGYSVAYPFGVIGPILCFYFLTRRVKPAFPPKPARFHMGEVTIERLPAAGATLGAVLWRTLPEGVQVASVRQEHHNRLPDPAIELHLGDALLSSPIARQRWTRWRPRSAGSSRGGSPRTAATSPISGSSSPRPGLTGQAAGRTADAGGHADPVSCMSAATTWTSCRRRT